jgi:hypothetical protein
MSGGAGWNSTRYRSNRPLNSGSRHCPRPYTGCSSKNNKDCDNDKACQKETHGCQSFQVAAGSNLDNEGGRRLVPCPLGGRRATKGAVSFPLNLALRGRGFAPLGGIMIPSSNARPGPIPARQPVRRLKKAWRASLQRWSRGHRKWAEGITAERGKYS